MKQDIAFFVALQLFQKDYNSSSLKKFSSFIFIFILSLQLPLLENSFEHVDLRFFFLSSLQTLERIWFLSSQDIDHVREYVYAFGT